jgi:hypothetical protein
VPAPIDIVTEKAARLEDLLGILTSTHEQMIAVALDHRSAISRADAAGVQACIDRQAALAARVGTLDQERRALTQALAPGRTTPTVSALAQTLAEPTRSKLLAAAAKLRDVLLRLQRENSVLRAATQSLVAHMDGLIQQVARALSQTRLYSPQGRIDSGSTVPACGLDLTH